jgi:hypothetical protein
MSLWKKTKKDEVSQNIVPAAKESTLVTIGEEKAVENKVEDNIEPYVEPTEVIEDEVVESEDKSQPADERVNDSNNSDEDAELLALEDKKNQLLKAKADKEAKRKEQEAKLMADEDNMSENEVSNTAQEPPLLIISEFEALRLIHSKLNEVDQKLNLLLPAVGAIYQKLNGPAK